MDTQYFLKAQGLFFRLFGLQLSAKTMSFKSPALALLFIVATGLAVWPVSVFAWRNFEDVDKLTQATAVNCFVSLTIIKFGIFFHIRQPLARIIDALKHILIKESGLSPTYADIIQMQNKQEQRLCQVYGIIMLLTLISSSLFPLVTMLVEYLQTGEAEIILQHPAEFPVDISYLPYYLLFYASNFIGGYGIILSALCVDSLFSAITFNLSALFRIAQYKVSHLDWNLTSTLASEQQNLFCMHQKTLEMGQEFDTVFEPLVGIQFFMSSLQICLTGFQVGGTKFTDFKFFFNVCLFLTALLQIFIYSYCGEVLKTESYNFSVSVYNGQWYEAPKNVARSLHIALVRSQRPCINSGYFFEANMFTFSSIVRTAMSYITMLRSFS